MVASVALFFSGITFLKNGYPDAPGTDVRASFISRAVFYGEFLDMFNLALRKMLIARDESFSNPLANRMTLLYLEMEKRWLFPQPARELP